MRQSNVQRGTITRNANADLTGKRSYLAKLVNNAGDPQVALPSAITDACPYLITSENTAGLPADIEPLHPEQNVRLPLAGACNTGDVLVVADPAVAGQPGQVQALPAGAGTYRQIAVAEEQGIDGQFVLCRPSGQALIAVVE